MSDPGESGLLLPTLPRTPSLSASTAGASFDSLKGAARFETGALIGKGGMGEVFSATDLRLKRSMAVKQATSTSAADLERFVREARVQGQLQHPGIVPVHELGLTPEGLPYFTMKRVQGETLSDVLEALRHKNPGALQKHTRRRLLAAFQSVCQAVEFAHSQGVLHRDLKPANVMLGDFGEVYVLDWGLAKPMAQAEDAPAGPALLDGQTVGATPTVAGSLMGTPGYMSPELVVGQPASVQSDVFALGSMLFEVLTLQRLVSGDTVMTILTATRDGYDPSARNRCPESDLAPELDLVVQRACARGLSARYPTVRALHDALERVLAGERDHELRAEMAKAHAGKAAAELAGLRSGSADDEGRRRALQEVGRSLALDPKNGAAFSTLLELLQTPPKERPAEVQQSIEQSHAQANRTASKLAAVGMMLEVLLLPWFLTMGSTNWFALGGLLVLMTMSAMASFGMSRLDKPRPSQMLIGVTAFMLLGAAVNIFLVPLIVATPMIIVSAVMYVSLIPKKFRVLTVALAALALSAPYLTWAVGWTPAPVQLIDGKLIIEPRLLNLHPFWTHALILDAMISTLVVGAIASVFLRRTLERAQERIATQAWNLRQLLPPEAGNATLLEDTAADPKCALQDFYESKGFRRAAGLARATLHGS
jgi:eukaryotic-like serine/threonine-protein kinase